MSKVTLERLGIAHLPQFQILAIHKIARPTHIHNQLLNLLISNFSSFYFSLSVVKLYHTLGKLIFNCYFLMANSDSTLPVPASAPSPLSTKENVIPASSKIAELTESRQELLNRIQSLKTDLQSWRHKLDGQVKVYRDELSELKKSLNVEVEQLRSEFQELKTTLQQQQEDVTTSLRNLGLQDASEETKEAEDVKPDNNEENAQDLPKEIGKDTEE